MNKIDSTQMSQWLNESTSTYESPQNRLRRYISDFENVAEDQKQDYIKEMLKWLRDIKYVPFDLDVATSIELISILIRHDGEAFDALLMILLLSHQNYLVAGFVDRGFIANEMLRYLLYNGDFIMKFCEDILEIMLDDPMFNIQSEMSDIEEEKIVHMYPNVVGAFVPAYHWLKENYPQVCYDIPEDFINQIISYSDPKNAFKIYSSLCRFLYIALPEINDD